MKSWKTVFPIFDWGSSYTKSVFGNDMMAAIIVTIMLIPQSLAYAMIAGLPAQVGLYASILPLVAYAIFGTSRALAVGPVAVASLMTASALNGLGDLSPAEYLAGAIMLALLSGIMLIVLGVLRLGAIANYLSHPVISGFITASGLLIAINQLKPLLGLSFQASDLPDVISKLFLNIPNINIPTALIGIATLIFLYFVKLSLPALLKKTALPASLRNLITKSGPMIGVLATIAICYSMSLHQLEVAIVGDIPQGFPPFAMPDFNLPLIESLLVPSLLIALVGFIESVSVGQTLAAKRRQKINPNQEFIGLGTANVASAFSGGYPVTGGFARSVVNFDAGAETPAAGAFTAVGILLAAMFLTPVLYYLPRTALAATIIVAVLGLVDFSALTRTWKYSKADFVAMIGTISLTLILSVEAGIVIGVVLSLALHLYRTSRPHYAIIGQVGDTEHFRNVKRHAVRTDDHILSVRIDESLYFANARYFEDEILAMLVEHPEIDHLILQCNAVNHIDASAFESIEAINERLKDMDIKLHLSEVKGPIQDRLERTDFLQHLSGNLYLTQIEAVQSLRADTEYHI